MNVEDARSFKEAIKALTAIMPQDKPINKSITINAPASKVWESLTDPKIMKLWLSDTEMIVTSEWKVGSPIVFSGKWYGKDYKDKGTILELEPGKVFEYTFQSGLSKLPDTPENYTVIRFELVAEGDITILTFSQVNLITEAIYAHSNYYWGITLGIIKKLVEDSI